ncbi:MAG: TerB family tellurite resistance protein [Pirellulaceae bacterium]|nr:hypothetical protein [Planctomycetales bacterium]MCA9206373.1 hypothetical protein [Planctomycetales bacterium]MCA9209490.1 hypothetical protein [Planctomycetales bacterium]MCA9219997.1 hypothetical protein [Planctomycetales bacterium]MCA9226290.1 hypothetical protein [Planctomycetales bacterium]
MDRQTNFQNLMVMAAADGSFNEQELSFLSERCQRWGLSEGEFTAAIAYALSPSAKLTIPESAGERRGLLRELLLMMAADGQLAEIEKQLFAVAAAQMEISTEELDQMIDTLLTERGQK